MMKLASVPGAKRTTAGFAPTRSAAVEVAAEDHPYLIRLAISDNFVAGFVDDRVAVFVLHLVARVAEVEVQLAVWAEHKRMNAVVVLSTGDAGEECFFLV